MKPLAERIIFLKESGLMGQMVAAEFLWQSIAPLQSHTRPLWTLGGLSDPMRLSTTMLDVDAVNYATRVLFGTLNIGNPSEDLRPLYSWSRPTREAIIAAMPTIDEKGLEGDKFLQEGDEEGTTTKEDGAREDEESGRESQAGASQEVIPVPDFDDEEVERAPHAEAPFVMVLPEDSDVEEDDLPLAVRARNRVVLSEEDLGGTDISARREEVSLTRAHTEATPAGGSQ